jgi:allantoicase
MSAMITSSFDQTSATAYVNLADERLGAKALSCSDEYFALASRMLSPTTAVFHPGKFDDHGQYMEGWETRRKRVAGYDWCIVQLGLAGKIVGVDIDTSHFTGNYPVAASLDACRVNKGENPDNWQEILHAVTLGSNAHHFHGITVHGHWTHVRLNIYPDGGIARLRIYGIVQPPEDKFKEELDLLALENGGRAIAASDEHYGNPWALLRPGRGINMGDGWETRRRRVPGNEWCILALGQRGKISRIILDTAHYKGNYPDRCIIQAANLTIDNSKSIITQSMFWQILLPEQKLTMNAIHTFEKDQMNDLGLITLVRVNIIPDGGLSRVRLFGQVE